MRAQKGQGLGWFVWQDLGFLYATVQGWNTCAEYNTHHVIEASAIPVAWSQGKVPLIIWFSCACGDNIYEPV